jgi:Tfp pilus assembly protein PilF
LLTLYNHNMIHKNLFLAFFLLPHCLFAQKASVTEESRELLTYPFSDANPVPILTGSHKNIYPYHSFDGYAVTGKKQAWKVIKLENDYIEVYVLPEAGGKVWGAIEKSTGKEFIYRNEVMKFRNIAMRGPWTSGGIEFNFGIIGHNPGTANPVDYTTKENSDGSVSCFVGNMDLPSRTQWRVEIRLPKDKAYFETRALWNNPTPVSQSYYNWMTAAAVVTDDLEFFYPGNQALEHNGEANPWPIDKDGHNLSPYRNNAFGSHKSVHIVGEYNDFMGGYYHKSNFGFGHWALYDDMPGHKLWLWSQAREGAIWKDLLTDSDGQYMEFQAGRGFNQYSASDVRTPISEMTFPPNQTDRWTEMWFPVKEIGGLQEVSQAGVLNVTHQDGTLQIAINALAFADAKIIVRSNEKVVYTQDKKFTPMEVFKASVPLAKDAPYELVVEGMDLQHGSVNKNEVKRPFKTTIPADENSAAHLYQQGMELKEARNYTGAKISLTKCLQKDALYMDALAAMAELFYHSNQYDSALYFTNQALQLDSYHPAANYYAGINYRAKGDLINALETFGWAARSMEFRSAAYAQMAGLELQLNNLPLAAHYAIQSLDFNKNNVVALEALAIQYRKSGNTEMADKIIEQLNQLDPLNHFAHFEKYLLHPSAENYTTFSSAITNEFPYQTYLEVMLDYADFGLQEDALKVLEKGPAHALLATWKAYLSNDESLLAKAADESPAFVFPYRTETIAALEWAISKTANWKFKYYLGLNYWGIERLEETTKLFQACGNEPDYAPFYSSRAFLLKGNAPHELTDLQKAKTLSPTDWRNWNRLIEYYENTGDNKMALTLATQASQQFKGNYNLALQFARVQLNNGQYEASTKTLDKTVILPFEGSTSGKTVYEQAYINVALNLMAQKKYKEAFAKLEKSKAWPESLGVGAPYEPDNRMQQYLQAICMEKTSGPKGATALRDSITAFTMADENYTHPSFNNLLALHVLKNKGATGQANALVEKIKTAPAHNQAVHRFTVAAFLNDTNTMESLQKDFTGNNYYKIFKRIEGLEK